MVGGLADEVGKLVPHVLRLQERGAQLVKVGADGSLVVAFTTVDPAAVKRMPESSADEKADEDLVYASADD